MEGHATSFEGRCREVAYQMHEDRSSALPSRINIAARGIVGLSMVAVLIVTHPDIIDYSACWYMLFNQSIMGLSVGIVITFFFHWWKRSYHLRPFSRDDIKAVSMVTFESEDGPVVWEHFARAKDKGWQAPEESETTWIIKAVVAVILACIVSLVFLVTVYLDSPCIPVAMICAGVMPQVPILLDRFLGFRLFLADVSKKKIPGVPPFYALYEDGVLLVNGQHYPAKKIHEAELKNLEDDESDGDGGQELEEQPLRTTTSLALSCRVPCRANKVVLTLPVPRGQVEAARHIVDWFMSAEKERK